jgi:DNA-binding IclR family transcriptional regulator
LLNGWTLEARTPNTITDHELLRKELSEIRQRGWAQNLHESEVGVLSVAAPIRDSTNTVVAAMSLAGPAQRMDDVMPELTRAVVEAAAVASKRLGHARRA